MEALKKAAALAAKIQGIKASVLESNIQRGDIFEAVCLAIVSGRPAFLLGPPGVNKTGTVQAIARFIDGAEFYEALMPTIVSVEQLLVESTSIEEVPTADGGKEIRTRDQLGRAANAHVMFADEIWKAEPRLLQTLLDLSKGDGVRHGGSMVKTPLLAFLAASNELPDPDGQLGAMWSRMTIRLNVRPLDRRGKAQLVKARLNRQRGPAPAKLTLEEIETLRQARRQVQVPDEIVETVFEIYQTLLDQSPDEFAWLWSDDRRFGRVFDVLQAHALLDGRDRVAKADLAVLRYLLWDEPEQIATVEAVLAPYCRTPVSEAQEFVDALLVAGGLVAGFLAGANQKATDAIRQCKECKEALEEKRNQAGAGDAAAIQALINQVKGVEQQVVATFAGI